MQGNQELGPLEEYDCGAAGPIPKGLIGGDWEDLLTSGRLTSASIADGDFGSVSRLELNYDDVILPVQLVMCELLIMLVQFGLGELPPYNELERAIEELSDPSPDVRYGALQVP